MIPVKINTVLEQRRCCIGELVVGVSDGAILILEYVLIEVDGVDVQTSRYRETFMSILVHKEILPDPWHVTSKSS